MIEEDYVSYEVAKLLQEKGFDTKCRSAYHNKCLVDYTLFGFCDGEDFVYAPSLASAMKLLREVNGLFVFIGNDDMDYYWQIEDVLNRDENYDPIIRTESYAGYKSYEEAVEAALEYTLKNLI